MYVYISLTFIYEYKLWMFMFRTGITAKFPCRENLECPVNCCPLAWNAESHQYSEHVQI